MPQQIDSKPIQGPESLASMAPRNGTGQRPRPLDPSSSPGWRDAERAAMEEIANIVNSESPTMQPLSRRPTFESTRRTISPPNSVKAFANARRRGPEGMVHESKAGHRQGGYIVTEADDQGGEEVASSGIRSCRSRSHTNCTGHRNLPGCAVTALPGTDTYTCDTTKQRSQKEGLYIDFEYLETLTNSEGQRVLSGSDFENLPDSSVPASMPMFTSDGDIIDVVSEPASVSAEKNKTRESAPTTQQHPEQSRFNYFSSALESTIHAAEFGDLILPGENIRSLFELPKEESDDGVWWLNMNSPSASEVWTICKAFGIHPLTIEDIIHQESREKIELFPSYYFACFRSFTVIDELDGTNYQPFNVYVVVFREGIISFSFTPSSHASRVRFRISQLKEQVSLSSDWICYALIDDIVDSFGPAINQIEHEADAIEDQVFITRVEDNQAFLRRIGLTRKNVMSLMRLLGGKADVLRAFTKRCTEDYDVTPQMDIALYLGDIQDHALTMMNSLVHFDTILSRSHSNYLAQLSIDNIDMGNRTNDFLSRVTVIATVIVPLNVVCGLFGMNVKVPWGGVENLNAFFGIMSGIIAFALISLVVARRMGYL
ncbi:putative metal ion transporter C27B12.12c 1 [Colletotrichum chlorophyti]|uniref:Putative metal ion transporter C27B12.12c 1 n=1 Tax=Colletotrichum chlorophyti TaxID=708187 RepID=A0A1Q8S846_9PEZI|nr:putative metal ion transporter C27B12.12c 1 [Colletotrichum chlorophyti]